MESLQLEQLLVGQGPAQEDLLLTIQPSSSWTPAGVEHVSSLIQCRNQFVCMQLVTMVKEQHSKVAAAAAAGDTAAMHAAKYMFLATLTSSSSNTVLTAGIFYPRACSKDGVELPHVYVELVCCNSPGKGLGSLLLQHIEQFVADNCDSISEGFFGMADPAGEGAAPMQDMCMDVSTADSCSNAGITCADDSSTAQQAAPAQRRSYSSLPVLLPGEPSMPAGAMASCKLPPGLPAGMCLSASTSSISSMASNASTSTNCGVSTGSSMLGSSMTGSCASLASMQLTMPAQDLAAAAEFANGLPCDCGNNAAALPGALSTSSLINAPTGVGLAGGVLLGNADNRGKLCRSCKLIQGIKLLSVQSAQGFYSKCGYGAPDSCCEMFKPLPALRHNVPAALPHQAAF